MTLTSTTGPFVAIGLAWVVPVGGIKGAVRPHNSRQLRVLWLLAVSSLASHPKEVEHEWAHPSAGRSVYVWRLEAVTIVGLNRKTILGGICLAFLTAGSAFMGTGPADAQAQLLGERTATQGPLDIVVHTVTLVPGVTAEHALEIKLQVRAAQAGVFIERASGTVTVELDSGGSMTLPFDVRQVQPGAVLTSVITIDWDETDPLHRQLRRDAASAEASFSPHAIRIVDVSPIQANKPVLATRKNTVNSPIRASLH